MAENKEVVLDTINNLVIGNKEKARVMYNSIAEAFILMFFEVKTKKESQHNRKHIEINFGKDEFERLIMERW